jgi:hypothetical protein
MATVDADANQKCFEDDSDGDEEEISINSEHNNGLILLEIIGTGAYGAVYRAIWRGQLIAAKVIEHDSNGEDTLITKENSFCPFEKENTVDDGVISRSLDRFALIYKCRFALYGLSAVEHLPCPFPFLFFCFRILCAPLPGEACYLSSKWPISQLLHAAMLMKTSPNELSGLCLLSRS